MVRYWGEERAARSIPVRSIIDMGIPTGGGTDAPVVDWNPFESMWWMTTRQIFAGGKVRTLGPEEAISREEALRLYTMGSAGIEFMEDRAGSIEPRKLADLAVLSDDLLTVPDEAMRGITSLLTMVGGRIVYQNGLD
jgi:predicted amidohydrolase YtcJ